MQNRLRKKLVRGAIISTVMVLSTAVLASCARGVWRNSRVTNEQAQRDLAACRLLGMDYGMFDRQDAIYLCMESKGYRLEPR